MTNVVSEITLLYHQFEIYTKDANKYLPMGQVIAGMSYFFTDSQFVGVDYRYMITPENGSLNSRVNTESINLVINFSFG